MSDDAEEDRALLIIGRAVVLRACIEGHSDDDDGLTDAAWKDEVRKALEAAKTYEEQIRAEVERMQDLTAERSGPRLLKEIDAFLSKTDE